MDIPTVKEIEKLFAGLRQAWNNGNAHAYALCFTENCDYVTYHGKHLLGRNNVEQFHHDLFTGFLKGSTLHGEITFIRFITTETAIVHHEGSVQLRFQRSAPVNRRSINTNVLVKENGQWKVTAFHNCRIKKQPFIIRLLQYMQGNNTQ